MIHPYRALIIIPAYQSTARSVVRTADPTAAAPIGSAVGTSDLCASAAAGITIEAEAPVPPQQCPCD